MNFNIIDGDDHYIEQAPEFARLYNDPDITVQEIKNRMGLTKNPYEKLRKYCLEHGLIRGLRGYKPKSLNNPRYYTHTVQRGIEYWIVNKTINGRLVHFATFKKQKQAERMVELLKECNWDIDCKDVLKERVLNE